MNDEVEVTLRFRREDAQHAIDVLKDSLGDYAYALRDVRDEAEEARVVTLVMPSRLAELDEYDKSSPEAKAFIALMTHFGYTFVDFGEYNPPTCEMLFRR